MLAEGLRIAVRPRGILECLDLAVMFCGRRPLAVAVATAIGAAPCILLNRAILAGAGDDSTYLAMILLGVEAAWASIPLTLYLGQSVFSDRFSWRTAADALLGSLPALIVFQGFMRLACLAVWFLAPVVFVSMYYCNQIILLERPGLSRVWRRQGAINRGRIRVILACAMLDGLVLVAGTALGTHFLDALSALWHGRGVSWVSAAVDGNAAAPLFSWHGQIAFWATCGFLTVVRFFSYLDTRIRREGWDVELRLRSDETYAGLRHGTARAGAGVAVLLAASIGAVAAGPAAAAEGTARQALSRQSFPWYDSASDRYRPLIKPRQTPPTPETSPDSESVGKPAVNDGGRRRGGGSGRGGDGGRRRGGGSGRGGGDGVSFDAEFEPPPRPEIPVPAEVIGVIGWVLMILLLVVAAAALIAVVVRHGLGDRRKDGNASLEAAEAVDEEAALPLPAGITAADGDLLARAAACAERGDFAAAMPFLHAWMLVELDRRGGLVLARGKTNGQYRAEVSATAPRVADVFGTSCRLFEDSFFGHLTVDRDAFLDVWERKGLVTAETPRLEIVR